MAATPHGVEFDPVRIGLLLDWPVGVPANLIEPIQLAFEEAHAARRIPRRIELVVEEAHGLSLHAAKNAIDGYRRLVDAGCVGVIGPLISDNAIALAPVVDALQVPAISWCGTERFHGAYCFDLGNGGSLNGIVAALATLAGVAGPNTTVVPGHGPITNRAAIVAHRDMVLAVRDKVRQMVAEGRSVEEIVAAKPTAEFDERTGNAAGSAERFLRQLYSELKDATTEAAR